MSETESVGEKCGGGETGVFAQDYGDNGPYRRLVRIRREIIRRAGKGRKRSCGGSRLAIFWR